MKLSRILILTLLITLAYVVPVHAQGCGNMRPNSRGGLLGFLGLTGTAEIGAQRNCVIQQVKGQSQQRVAEIEADAQVRIQQIRTELAAVENERFASAHDRDVRIAEAQADAQYKISGVESERDQQIAYVQGERDIAITEVVETGATNRLLIEQGNFARNAFAVGSIIVIVVLAIGYVLVAYQERRPAAQPAQLVVPVPVLLSAQRYGAIPQHDGIDTWNILTRRGEIVDAFQVIDDHAQIVEQKMIEVNYE